MKFGISTKGINRVARRMSLKKAQSEFSEAENDWYAAMEPIEDILYDRGFNPQDMRGIIQGTLADAADLMLSTISEQLTQICMTQVDSALMSYEVVNSIEVTDEQRLQITQSIESEIAKIVDELDEDIQQVFETISGRGVFIAGDVPQILIGERPV